MTCLATISDVCLSVLMQDWGKEILGPAWVLMPLAVLFSTFGAANGLCYSSGRLVYSRYYAWTR